MAHRRSGLFVLTILAYLASSFTVQALSHFAINAEHYAAITIMRSSPVVLMGVTSMVIQGAIFALLFPRVNHGGSPMRNALVFSWALGAFLASYIALGEAGKYAIPSIPSWIAIETAAAFAQFTLFGLLLGALHRHSGVPRVIHHPA